MRLQTIESKPNDPYRSSRHAAMALAPVTAVARCAELSSFCRYLCLTIHILSSKLAVMVRALADVVTAGAAATYVSRTQDISDEC